MVLKKCSESGKKYVDSVGGCVLSWLKVLSAFFEFRVVGREWWKTQSQHLVAAEGNGRNDWAVDIVELDPQGLAISKSKHFTFQAMDKPYQILTTPTCWLLNR